MSDINPLWRSFLAVPARNTKGPIEATLVRNVIVQVIASGESRSLDKGRAILRKSFKSKKFLPR